MSVVTFRLYEELNRYLPMRKRKTDFEVRIEKGEVIGAAIESLGVPLAEVDLILANGESVDFEYVLRNRDRVSVYPVFERLDIADLTRLPRRPLRKTRFIADVNLGELAGHMRVLGLDVHFDASLCPEEIIEISNREKRIILTKNRGLLDSKDVRRGLLLQSGTPNELVRKLLHALDILDIKTSSSPSTKDIHRSH